MIYDTGQGKEAASKRIGALAQAMTTSLPDLDFLKQGFNTGTVLGELNAGSVPTSLVLGITYAHHSPPPGAGRRHDAAPDRMQGWSD